MTQQTEKIQRIALVTGAARGIGLATTRRLLALGHRVAMIDRDAAELANAATQFPADRTMLVTADLSLPEAAEMIEKEVSSHFGTVSILVNNAGIAPKHDGHAWNVVEITLDEWHSVMAVNLTAALLLCKRFIPGMQKQKFGRIINVSSSAGRTSGFANGPAYMASKAGLLGITRHIAGTFGKDGITANAVAPGRIITPLSMQWTREREEAYNSKCPVRRSGTAEEAAAAIAYLADEASGFTNGAVIDINGGMFMS